MSATPEPVGGLMWPGFLQAPEDLTACQRALAARGMSVSIASWLDLEWWASRLRPGMWLLGYSMGARYALRLALQAARRGLELGGLVLISGAPGIEEADERRARRKLDEERAQALASDPAGFVDGWGQLPIFGPLRAHPSFAALQAARKARLGPGEAARFAALLRQLGPGTVPALWDALPTLRTPTLWVAGALDAKYVALAKRAQRLMPHARCAVLPDVGHVLPLEAPEALAAAIARFQQHPPARSAEAAP